MGEKGRTARRSKKMPRWDRRQMTLWWGDVPIKEFNRNAPGQMFLLDEFQTNGWPALIDLRDLPGSKRGKHWIANTVTNLNRGLLVIWFHADGANGLVRWGLRK